MRKIVFFDIDGTLIDAMDGKFDMSDKVKEAIHRLQTEGNYVFIATGRPYAYLSEAIKGFGFDGMIAANGAQIMLKGETIFTAEMDKEFIHRIVEGFEANGIQYVLECEDYSYVKPEYVEFYDFFKEINISSKWIKGSYNLDDLRVLKVETICADEEAANYCETLLKSHPEYDCFSSVAGKVYELYQKKYTKASAILRVLKHLDLPLEASFAFGDGVNDTEMLQAVGCGVAMDNASDYVKSYADQVTDSVHEDGVATGIMKYILC
ncbi:MAG: HAD family hydrolase [bacterium]|nr:HAD family hydrolase [bacterium]